MPLLRMRATEVHNAVTRYYQRSQERERNKALLRQGKLVEANDPQRFSMRMRHIEDLERADRKSGAKVTELAKERVIGKSDFLEVSFLSRGLRASEAVGRIVSGMGSFASPIGTGFMISPSLLMTNNHVIGTRAEAESYDLQMRYQRDDRGDLQLGIEFKFDPGAFFYTSVELDFTIVAVSKQSTSGVSLRDFGHIPLTQRRGKVLVGEYATIIQHPNGEPKQIALRENRVVDILDDYLHYETDTAPGTSGSAVLNDQWELLGLHHSGVPAQDRDGNYLATDGSIWREEMGEDNIKWVANEGVRTSRIVETLKALSLTGTTSRLLAEALNQEGASIVSKRPEEMQHSGSRESTGAQRSISFTIPVTITIGIGETTTQGVPNLHVVTHRIEPEERGQGQVDRSARTAADYADRDGYDPQFLGKTVDFPDFGRWGRDLTKLADGSSELKYTHYSVFMSHSRRIALLTAVNIDGELSQQLGRKDRGFEKVRIADEAADFWRSDPRIDVARQITENELYDGNDLDLGHLVRREDPVWGDLNTARKANDDTFHFTNCSPQHKDLNQRTWLDLENHILKNARTHGLKVTVFTGPVFADDDPEYRGILIPKEYWKVVAMPTETGKLSVTAYLQSQENLLMTLEGFRYGEFKTYQVPLSTIEQRTGLSFGSVREFENQPSGGFVESTRRGVSPRRARLISSASDIRL